MDNRGVPVHCRCLRAHFRHPCLISYQSPWTSTGSVRLCNHFDRVTGTLLEANGGARTRPAVVSISPPRTKLDDRVLWTSRRPSVAREAMAAGEAARRFLA